MSNLSGSGRYRRLLLFLLLGMFVQFFTVPMLGTHLKIYMVLSAISFIILGGNLWNRGLFMYERIWIFSYICLALSIFWAADIGLGTQLILGEIVLLLFYFVMKSLFDRLPELEIGKVLILAFRVFVFVSILLYIAGLASIYIYHNEGSYAIGLNETSLRIFGCYKEAVLVRFVGLAESPNNYAYFANVVLWFFVWKRKHIDALITLITVFFTFSTTAYVVLVVQVFLYFYWERKFNPMRIGLLCICFYFIFNQLLQYSDFQLMIEDRMSRNMTGSGRFELWKYSLDKIYNGPIFGYGINQSRTLFTERNYISSHNNIIEMGLSLGVLGCLVYIIYLLSLLKLSFSFVRKAKIPFVGQLAVALFIFGLSNNTLHIEYTVFAMVLIAYYIRSYNPLGNSLR